MSVILVIFLFSILPDEEVAHFFIVTGVRGLSWVLTIEIVQNFIVEGHVGSYHC